MRPDEALQGKEKQRVYLFSGGTLGADALRRWANEIALGWRDDEPIPAAIRKAAQRLGIAIDAFVPPSAEEKRLLAHLGHIE